MAEQQTFDAGFSIRPGVLSKTECDEITAAVCGVPKPGRAGSRHLMSHPVVLALATDARLLAAARNALGERAVPFRATLFEKSADANWLVPWHQDTALPITAPFCAPGWGPWSRKAGIDYAHAPTWALSRTVALRVHLDASGADNGPLRVIPTSHALGVLTDAEVADHARAHTPVECVVPRGGVLCMRPLLIH